jgi:hypothetical protein
MASLLDRITARFAFLHARRVYARFARALADVDRAQQLALERVLHVVQDGELGREWGLRSVRNVADLRRAVPLTTYEDYRPTIDRVCAGDLPAMFSPGQRVHMFATSSGTTAQPKRIPVTTPFVEDYRRGWNTFGLKLLSDHPAAVLRGILQSSSRHDADRTAAGIPCGAITGLLARTQKRIVRRYYVGCPEIAHLPDPAARYYTLMRLGIVRDVAFAVTANPATLIQMARTANEQSETLIRDVRDGTLSATIVPDAALRQIIGRGLHPDPQRAAELERIRDGCGTLRPRDYWKITFLACWTGGSLGHYLGRLADWWGPVPVRDVGLLASEGRVSIPLADGTPAGVLDVTSGVFEFIPADSALGEAPETVTIGDLAVDREYAVVLSNTTGLLRYRLNDVVRVVGWQDGAPLVEFLYRAGRVASVAGEKLTENQAVAAVKSAAGSLGLAEFDFVLAPCWSDPPHYRLSCPLTEPAQLAETIDAALATQNDEYASRRKSGRLGGIEVRTLPQERFAAMQQRLADARRSTAEQFKPPALFTQDGEDDAALGIRCESDSTAADT